MRYLILFLMLCGSAFGAFAEKYVTADAPTYEVITLDVSPVVDWAADDVVTGQTSAKTCTVVAKLTATTYVVKSRNGAYTLDEVIGVTGVADKLADQGAANPTFANSDGSATYPWTLTQAMASATSGNRVNIKSGSYSLGTTTVPGGGLPEYLVFRGYSSAIGDLDAQGRSSDGTLNTTNFPDITITGIWTPGTYTVFQNLDITGALSSSLIGSSTVDSFMFVRCRVVNTQNNSSAKCVLGDNDVSIIGCDFACTGAAHSYLVDADACFVAEDCRFLTTADTILVYIDTGTVINSLFYAASNQACGIYFQVATAASNRVVSGCTFYNLDEAITFPNTEQLAPAIITNCHITDCVAAIYGAYNATEEYVVLQYNNRTRDNGADTGIWEMKVGAVTTDGGGIATDFTNAGSGNFLPIADAPCVNSASVPYRSIGMYQIEYSEASVVYKSSGNGGFYW